MQTTFWDPLILLGNFDQKMCSSLSCWVCAACLPASRPSPKLTDVTKTFPFDSSMLLAVLPLLYCLAETALSYLCAQGCIVFNLCGVFVFVVVCWCFVLFFFNFVQNCKCIENKKWLHLLMARPTAALQFICCWQGLAAWCFTAAQLKWESL